MESHNDNYKNENDMLLNMAKIAIGNHTRGERRCSLMQRSAWPFVMGMVSSVKTNLKNHKQG